jgi:hypothetical protein
MSDVCPQCGSSNLGSNEGSFVCFECGAVRLPFSSNYHALALICSIYLS